MLRMNLKQQWYSLSHPAMEAGLFAVSIMRSFAGIKIISKRISDESTIHARRQLLKKYNVGEQIFQAVKARLRNRGVAMGQGTMIDATLNTAPSSTEKKGERSGDAPDLEGQPEHNGIKVVLGVGKD
jgi:IS5 family transposase